MTTQFFPRTSLILLLCATPLTAFAQQTTSSTSGPAAVPTIAEILSVTPKFGQTQQQLTVDRTECGQWAHGQTGFDAGQIGGGVARSDYNARRQQYGRAVAAYTVTTGATSQDLDGGGNAGLGLTYSWWNAGVGLETAIANRASLFVEACYLRILPNSNQTKFVPITFGLRF
jgi:hypothetical protein